MPLYKNTLFTSDHIVKEYILVLKDESLKLFLDDGGLRSVGIKTNCYIELTNRILNRRVNAFKLIKYAIVKIVGVDESAIRQCNRLLENQFPLYRHRKEYQKRSECCTLYSQEFIPDNSSLYFPFQRTGATTYQFGDVLIKSPYEPTILRSNKNCPWRMGDTDLKKGITIAQRRQVETYLSYHFRNTSTEQEPYDPKVQFRYVYDDFNTLTYHRANTVDLGLESQIHKDDQEHINKYIKSTDLKSVIYKEPQSITTPTFKTITARETASNDAKMDDLSFSRIFEDFEDLICKDVIDILMPSFMANELNDHYYRGIKDDILDELVYAYVNIIISDNNQLIFYGTYQTIENIINNSLNFSPVQNERNIYQEKELKDKSGNIIIEDQTVQESIKATLNSYDLSITMMTEIGTRTIVMDIIEELISRSCKKLFSNGLSFDEKQGLKDAVYRQFNGKLNKIETLINEIEDNDIANITVDDNTEREINIDVTSSLIEGPQEDLLDKLFDSTTQSTKHGNMINIPLMNPPATLIKVNSLIDSSQLYSSVEPNKKISQTKDNIGNISKKVLPKNKYDELGYGEENGALLPGSDNWTVFGSQNTLNITSSKIWEGQAADILTLSGVTETDKNFHVINVDFDPELDSEKADSLPIDSGCNRYSSCTTQQIVNVEDYQKYEETKSNYNFETNLVYHSKENRSKVTLKSSLSTRIRNECSVVFEVEDAQAIVSPLKVEIIKRNVSNETLYKALYVNKIIRLELVRSCDDEVTKVKLLSKTVPLHMGLHPTIETWLINDSEIIVIHLSLTWTRSAQSSFEIPSQRNVLTDQESSTDNVIKCSEVFSSKFLNIKVSLSGHTASAFPAENTITFYTTISIDDEDDNDDSTKDSTISEHFGINPHLSIEQNTTSSETEGAEVTIDNEEEQMPCENLVVDREKVILIIRNDKGSPTTVVKLNQLRGNSSSDRTTYDTMPSSVCSSSVNIYSPYRDRKPSIPHLANEDCIKPILHNNCNTKKCGHISCKTASFDDDYISTSKKSTSHTSHAKQPYVKRTLLDLSRNVRSRQVQEQVATYKMCPEKEVVIDDTKYNFKTLTFDNSNDYRESHVSTDELLCSSEHSFKVPLKSRTRTFSDKIKSKAKQLISKFNPLKKDTDVELEANRYNFSDISRKSSIDSELSKNSLARYWNIHKFDSIKRMKVKGRSFSSRPPMDSSFSNY